MTNAVNTVVASEKEAVVEIEVAEVTANETSPVPQNLAQGGVMTKSSLEANIAALSASDILKSLLQTNSLRATPLDIEPYMFDQGGTKMVYLPFEVREALYNTEDLEDLIPGKSLYNDERRIENDAHRKNAQRSVSIPASNLYSERDSLKDFTESCLANNSEDDIKIGAKLLSITSVVNQHFDKMLESFTANSEKELSVDELLVGLNSKNLLFVHFDGTTEVAFLTDKAGVVESFMGKFLLVKGTVYVNYGSGLQKAEYTFKLPYFTGTLSLEELNLRCIENDAVKKEIMIARGKKYIYLTDKPRYMKYSGTLVRRAWYGNTSFKAKGRVMVDYIGMTNMDSNYSYYFGKDHYRNDSNTAKFKNLDINDSMYAACSPYVYGFSFISKQWGELVVDSLSEIEFREDAYDMLVMEKKRKQMIRALVETTYTGKKDVIDGKGGGCIFLLAGTPGVGKTLTAETVAELLKRPLYMVGVGELGTNVEALEENLRNILEIATTWNAVLLIDEADIFMEERSEMDVERNAMVGIFLRLLEYYEGVLFLTTNRAKNIDQAFFSRISMSIHYKPLTVSDRKKIWTNLSNLYDLNLDEQELYGLSKVDINGRQIKNSIRLAKALAMSQGQDVGYEDVCNVLDQSAEFNREMRGNILSRAVRYVKKFFA